MMVVTQRKSKYKTKVIFEPAWAFSEHTQIRQWCEDRFGPGGRGKNLRWRFGWTGSHNTYYFKDQKDATIFVLRWGSVK